MVNKVFLIGNLTRDPEVKYTKEKEAWCSFTIAVNRPKDQNGNSRADYIPVKCFGKQAENCGRYLKKGSKVHVDGMIQSYSYEHNGERRNGLECVVNNKGQITFLPSISQVQTEGAAPAATGDYMPVDTDELPF